MKQIEGVFAHYDYKIDVPITILDTENDEEAHQRANNMYKGHLYFDSHTSNLIHEYNDQVSMLDENTINCEKFNHEDGEWYTVHINKCVRAFFKEAIEEGKDVIPLEIIAYGVSNIEK